MVRRDLAGGLDRLVSVVSRRGVSAALAAGIVLVDWAAPQGELPFVRRGLLDEPCHLATAMIVLGALTRWRGRPPSRPFSIAMLSASVVIDVDHLPEALGSDLLTAGAARPYTHALWLVVLLAAISVVTDRRARLSPGAVPARDIAVGATLGVCAHFLRDVFTGPISLWWPVSDVGFELPHAWYVVALFLLVAVPARVRAEGARARAPGERPPGARSTADGAPQVVGADCTPRRRPGSPSGAVSARQ